MGLLDKAREEQVAGTVLTASQDGPKKTSHGAEYQRKQKEQRYQDGLAFQAFFESKGLLAEVQANATLGPALVRLTKQPGTGQSFGGMQTPLIYRLFGDNPKAGMKVSALEVFQKTRKGYNETKQQAKKWIDKGVAKVHYDDTSDPSNPVWVLDEVLSLPSRLVPTAEA